MDVTTDFISIAWKYVSVSEFKDDATTNSQMKTSFNRASDRMRKKITNYAEIFRGKMRKNLSIMRKK